MVLTLMKHEILRTWKPLLVLTGIPALLVLACALAAAFGPRWAALAALAGGSIVITALLLLVQVGLIADYWRSSYSSPGYLTHSVPVRGAVVYAVKLGWALLVSTAALLVALALYMLLLDADQVGNGGRAGAFSGELASTMGQAISGWPGWVLPTLAVFFVISLAMSLLQFHFSISVGMESRFDRLGPAGPVLVYVVTVVVMQLVLAASMFLVPFGVGMDTLTLERLSAGQMFSGGSDAMPLGFAPVIVLLTALLLWRTLASWNSRISLR